MLKTYFFDMVKSHYFDFSGRATRTQFWLYVLFSFIIFCVFAALGMINGSIGDIFASLAVIYGLAILLPSLGIAARRLRDGGFSPWLLLLLLLPPIGELALLIMWVLPSKK